MKIKRKWDEATVKYDLFQEKLNVIENLQAQSRLGTIIIEALIVDVILEVSR